MLQLQIGQLRLLWIICRFAAALAIARLSDATILFLVGAQQAADSVKDPTGVVSGVPNAAASAGWLLEWADSDLGTNRSLYQES